MRVEDFPDVQKEVIVVLGAFQELINFGLVEGLDVASPQTVALGCQIRDTDFVVHDECIPKILSAFFAVGGGFDPEDFEKVCNLTKLVMIRKLDREKMESLENGFGDESLR